MERKVKGVDNQHDKNTKNLLKEFEIWKKNKSHDSGSFKTKK